MSREVFNMQYKPHEYTYEQINKAILKIGSGMNKIKKIDPELVKAIRIVLKDIKNWRYLVDRDMFD